MNSAASLIFSWLILSHAPRLLMNHLPILLTRHLSSSSGGASVVKSPYCPLRSHPSKRSWVHCNLCDCPMFANCRARSLDLPQLLRCTFCFRRFSGSVLFIDFRARREHHRSLHETCLLMCRRAPLPLLRLQKSTSSPSLRRAKGLFFFWSRCSLQSFFVACFQPTSPLALCIPCRCSREVGSGVSLPLSKND